MADENNVPSAGADAGTSVLETAETTNTEAAVAEDVATEQQDGDEAEDESEPEAPRKKSGSARLRERLDREMTQRAVLEERLRALTEQRPAPAPVNDQPPREEDFNGDYFAWLSAKTVWEAEQRVAPKLKALEEQLQGRDRAAMQRDLASQFAIREAETRKAIPDYDDVMADADQVPASDVMLDVIKASERGPALAYHLAKNPETALKIANMPPLLAALRSWCQFLYSSFQRRRR